MAYSVEPSQFLVAKSAQNKESITLRATKTNFVQSIGNSAKTPILLASEKIKNLKIAKTETDQNSKTALMPNMIGSQNEEPSGDVSDNG